MRAHSRRVGWGAVALLCAVGCAAPSRHLTTRAVDDPRLLPRGLFSLNVETSALKYSTRADPDWRLSLPFRYGITDRLELEGLGLGYAFLDDGPAYTDGLPDGRRRGPLVLTAHAGLDGIGYSSLDGLIALPRLSVDAGKHLGGLAYLFVIAEANGAWVTSRASSRGLYTQTLSPPWPNSRFGFGAGGTVQVIDHLALTGGAGVHQIHACTFFDCAWAARGANVYLGPRVRPWRWLEVAVFGEAGARERAYVEVGMLDPSAMLPTALPGHVTWWGASATATFYW